MTKNSLYNYEGENLQKKTCLDFIKTLQEGVGVNIEEKDLLDSFKVSQLLGFSISLFDYLLCDDMRVHSGVLPVWTDSSAGYYRSDAQKMEMIKTLLMEKGIETDGKYVYLGPKLHIQEYKRIYGGTLIKFTPKFLVLITEQSKPEPILGTPRQEVFEELLMCGINPLRNMPVFEGKPDRSIHLYDIYPSKDKSPIDKKIEPLKKYYMKIFVHGVEIIPYASGTSANESVIRLLKRKVNIKGVYIHTYWYYENIPTIERIFQKKLQPNFSDANIFFINLDPTNFLNLDYDRKIISPDRLIEEIINIANSNPKEIYYMVIDNAVNPFANLKTLKRFLELENGRLLTTTSISKHQDGNRKYFFGVVSLYGKTCVFEEEIKRLKGLVNGHLYKYQERAFPELEPFHMKKRIGHIRALNKEFGKYFLKGDFFTENYTFNSVIYPKISPKRYRGTNYIEYNKHLEEFVKRIMLNFNKENFEYGDSFGLSTTRIIVQGDDFDFHLPRVSTGFNCDKKEIGEFAKYLKEELSKFDFKANVK